MKLDLTSDINKDYAAAMNYPFVDRFVVHVQWWTLAGLILLTFFNSVVGIADFYPSPFSWRVISPAEAIVTIIVGGLAALIPTLLYGKIRNHYLWRILVTFTLTTFAYLFVFISGGSIEMHFVFFAMIALIAIYYDWRLGWIMLVLIALHHSILNFTFPTWVYFYGRNDFAIIAHALPVIMAVVFTTVLSRNQRESVRVLLKVKADSEMAAVKLEKDNKIMVGRELRMIELKKEIENLKKLIKNDDGDHKSN